jgi:DHA2 family multidrug resistance protein
VRNIGSSIGISVVISYLAQRTQVNHAALAAFITPTNLALRHAAQVGVYDPASPAGIAALNAQVGLQAATLAYLQDFRMMMWITLASLPLIALLRAPEKNRAPSEPHPVME